MKVCILADSLGAPREDSVKDENRWPVRVGRSSDKLIINNLSKGASTTKKIKLLKKVRADLFIIQLGIVDCAPRTFTRFESKQLARLPESIRESIINWGQRNRTQQASRAYVSSKNFAKNIKKFAALSQGSRLLYVKISRPGSDMIEKNPGIIEQVVKYNEIITHESQLHPHFDCIEIPDDMIESITLDDGYHYNETGHEYLAKKIIGYIDNTF